MGIILVVGGVVIVVISFLGCCGASKEKKTMLCLFATILIAVFIAVLASGILAYVYWNQVETELKQEMLNTIEQYSKDEAITQAWDTVHQLFQCCGISVDADNSQNVWKRNPNFQRASEKVPASCCKSQDSRNTAQCQADPTTNAYTQDCYFAVKEFLQKHSHIFGGVAIGFVCILFFNILFSCILLGKIRRTEKVYVHDIPRS
ncbi:CD151 antigen-like [Uloborus diversus]|uniref:CD151 antigen-like n=1 Tax=Uloborus diversus TaxID=327109 RepID=UPI002409C6C7|nr:CD151 antigen-like [Uloborus diversus]